MGILQKLETLFNIKIDFSLNSPLFSLNIDKSTNITNLDSSTNNIETNNKTNELILDHYFDSNSNKLEVFIDKLTPPKQKIFNEIIHEHLDMGDTIMENSTLTLFNSIKTYQQNNEDDSVILNFFKDIIPQRDYEALEASLYLRMCLYKGKKTTNLKKDIRHEFGVRGNNIANLCSACYFESYFIPLYNSSKEEFKKLYNLSVSKSVLALFVHKDMNQIDIAREIKTKLNISKKYGLEFIHIHGIGKQNIITIKKCILANETLFKYFEKNLFEDNDNNILFVELLFKK